MRIHLLPQIRLGDFGYLAVHLADSPFRIDPRSAEE
jgi:hypothetical protein